VFCVPRWVCEWRGVVGCLVVCDGDCWRGCCMHEVEGGGSSHSWHNAPGALAEAGNKTAIFTDELEESAFISSFLACDLVRLSENCKRAESYFHWIFGTLKAISKMFIYARVYL
jgi:hypothetical protein